MNFQRQLKHLLTSNAHEKLMWVYVQLCFLILVTTIYEEPSILFSRIMTKKKKKKHLKKKK